ncbi:MAG TPA: hydrogenase maturation nickel metallochaperone HypA [Phycisphaerae bacterium]|nr:hydrogenase maturation nickel metallochaperone HypA [Phycisphaerae bacterium]
MHEASIAMAAIEQAIEVARRHGASRVTRIEMEIGILRAVVPEIMQAAFEACAIGTAAEGASLDLQVKAALARCRACDQQFKPDLEAISFACPACGQADADLLIGNDIILKSVECETPEEAESA